MLDGYLPLGEMHHQYSATVLGTIWNHFGRHEAADELETRGGRRSGPRLIKHVAMRAEQRLTTVTESRTKNAESEVIVLMFCTAQIPIDVELYIELVRRIHPLQEMSM